VALLCFRIDDELELVFLFFLLLHCPVAAAPDSTRGAAPRGFDRPRRIHAQD
jgi:hypothetical protein